MITICVPTNKTQAEVVKQREDILSTIKSGDVEVFASCQVGSAAFNRNYCLDKAKGNIIIMLDDDITGFFPGWDTVLVAPLINDVSVSMVSARLLKEDNSPARMMYDNRDYSPGYHASHYNLVPTGCVAFKKSVVRFDEFYTVRYEDADFCNQMKLMYPEKSMFINNDCKLVHKGGYHKHHWLEERKDRRHYHVKWGMVHNPKKQKMTVVYYTSNTEDPKFEEKIMKNIWNAKGALPVVSVSWKPVSFGKNICVGDVGYSYVNAFRQCLMACEAADTEYVAITESDCLYPPTGFFDFTPTEKEVVYSYDNIWILWQDNTKYHSWRNKDKYYKKDMTPAGFIWNRQAYIDFLKKSLEGLPLWSKKKFFPYPIEQQKIVWFHGDPIVSFKTVNAKNGGTSLEHMPPQDSIPYWGDGKQLKKRMFNDV
jgi:glycosyltransferase involved in cell wall biosynthesis